MANGMSRKEEDAYDDGRSAARKSAGASGEKYRTAEAMGFVGGALGAGALGPEGRGMLPKDIGGFDFDLVAGGALFLMSRKKNTKNAAYMRGASFALLAGGLKDQGAKLSKKV